MPTITLAVADGFSAALSSFASQVAAADGAASKMAGDLAATDAATAKLAAGTKSAGLTIQDFYYGLGLARQGIAALEGAYTSIYGPTTQLSDQIRKLQRDIGASAEEASKLIYAANQTGVSVDGMSKSFDMAINKMRSTRSDGIAPTIEGLGKLADQYNALKDPIAQTQFLIDNFGRSGANLAPMMALGSQGIKDLGNQAAQLGVVLDQKSVTGLHNADMATQKLGQALLGAKAIIAEFYAPAIEKAADALAHLTEQSQKAAVQGPPLPMQGPPIPPDYAPAVEAATIADFAHRDALAATTAELTKQNDAIQANIDKQNEATKMQAVQAGLQGTVTKGEEAYQKVVEGNTEKIAALRVEIGKYTAAQGESITVVNKGQVSAEQYSVAQDRLAIAEQRLTEYHGKSNATLQSLQLSVRTAADSVNKMSGELATSSTTTADYTQKIADDQKALDALTQANDDAAAAMNKANKELVFQALTAGLSADQVATIAHKMGLMDDASYNTVIAAEALNKAVKDNKISAEQAGTAGDNLATTWSTRLQPAFNNAPGVIDGTSKAFWDVQNAAHDAAMAFHEAHHEEDGLYSKEITLTVIHDDQYYEYHHNTAGGGNARAAGGPVSAGQPYTVGERGPELFVPHQNGTIIPNGGTTNHVNFGGVTINAAPGQSGEHLWKQLSAAAARATRATVLSGAGRMGIG